MLVVVTLTFFLVQLVPGDPASYLLGAGANAQQVRELHESLGLDRPELAQYTSWLGDAVRGDLGESLISGEPVTASIARALPVTLSVALLATVFSLVVGVPLGMLAAVRKGRVDGAVRTASSLTMAVPNYWLAALLVMVFAVKLAVLPATGYVGLAESPSLWLTHMLLPMIAAGAAGIGPIAFQARAATLQALGEDYVRTLAAAGIAPWRILGKHVLRNAAVPVITVAGLGFVFTLGSVVVIEAIFNLSGMGALMLRAVNSHDLPVVQGAVIFFALLVVAVNLLGDLLTAWLDPRARAK